MAKSNQIKKLVNGEIADADDVNQIAENVGTEGGLTPYSDDDQQRDTLGEEDIGTIDFPFGHVYVNREKELREIDTVSSTVAASVAIKDLRKFITMKDTPASYASQGGKSVRVKTAEDGLEFVSPQNIVVFTGNGNWVAPVGITKIKVTIVGGGGGGGGGVSGNTASGQGGGGGASVISHVLTVVPGNSYTVTVGAAGSAGPVATDGGNGGSSSFAGDDYTLSCAGGEGGKGGVGGTGGSGKGAGGAGNTDLNGTAGTGGNPGAGGVSNHHKFAGGNGGNGTSTGTSAGGGAGGGSMLGKGGNGQNNGVGLPGGIGAGGGGGGHNGGGGSGSAGGVGGAGIVLIEF